VSCENPAGIAVAIGMLRIARGDIGCPIVGVYGITPAAHGFHHKLIRSFQSARGIVNELRLAQLPLGQESIAIQRIHLSIAYLFGMRLASCQIGLRPVPVAKLIYGAVVFRAEPLSKAVTAISIVDNPNDERDNDNRCNQDCNHPGLHISSLSLLIGEAADRLPNPEPCRCKEIQAD
jgi:hypothetical protein